MFLTSIFTILLSVRGNNEHRRRRKHAIRFSVRSEPTAKPSRNYVDRNIYGWRN